MKRRVLIGLAIVVAISIVGYFAADRFREVPEEIDPQYVGRSSCIECHQTQASLFHGSDHDLAMDIATDSTVLADFNDQKLEHFGIVSRMFRDGERFMVNTEGPDGQMQDFQVKYVFGVRPLQQYMVELERPSDAKMNEIGGVQVLRISWDTVKKEWFFLMPPDVDEKLDPDDLLHWTGSTQNWNLSCAVCHSTDLKKNFNSLSGEYHTTFSEIDVSCEACHGPGSYHVELANRKSVFWDRKHGFGLAELKTTSNIPQVETCAPCHSRRAVIDDGFRPGCNFDDYFALQLISDPVYHRDGQIRGEDYVYGSFIQSKMYHNGIRCSDCHDPHSLKVKFTGNQLCTSCHQHPAGKYDTPNHHHHAQGSAGASCVECHMPETTFMDVDPRRDHSLRVPRPDLSLTLGTPNACSACHVDADLLGDRQSAKPLTQYLDWLIAAEEGDEVVKNELARVDRLMADAAESWFPGDLPADATRYYRQLAEGLAETSDSIPTLLKLANDGSAPAMFRASAMANLAFDASDESLHAAQTAIDDPEAMVATAGLLRLDVEIGRIGDRHRYGSSIEAWKAEVRPIAETILEMCGHPSRRVRLQAAQIFATLDSQSRKAFATPEQFSAYETALAEWKKSIYLDNDRASNHMMLGGIHEMLEESDRAKDNYRSAIAVEPNFSGPRSNLAALLEADADRLRQQLRQTQSGGAVAAGQLKSILTQIQQITNQSRRLRYEEYVLLGKDIQRSAGIANTHGLHYRFAMSSYLQGDMNGTEKHLREANRQDPENPAYLMGLATYYLQVNLPKEAESYIESLIKIDDRHPGYQALREQLNQMLEMSGGQDDDSD